MKNLWKIGFLFILFSGFTFQDNIVNRQTAPSVTLSGQQMNPIEVEEFSTAYKTAAVLLVLSNIIVYRSKKISEGITDSFEHYTLSWISLGMVIAAVFCAMAYQTDAFYETVFAVLAFLISPYYLFNQYQEASCKQMTSSLWLRVALIAAADIALMIWVARDLAVLIILGQNLFAMLWESHQVKIHRAV